MSVANHKKKDELKETLVVESIKICKQVLPKYFVFENVKSFLKTLCTNVDNNLITIKEAIIQNLQAEYNIIFKVINLKDYGAQSSRPRCLVIGVRRDINYLNPFDIFPDKFEAQKLRELIFDLPYLNEIGEISKNDIYHNFRKYDEHMRPWISDLKEGQSAFQNTDKKNPT